MAINVVNGIRITCRQTVIITVLLKGFERRPDPDYLTYNPGLKRFETGGFPRCVCRFSKLVMTTGGNRNPAIPFIDRPFKHRFRNCCMISRNGNAITGKTLNFPFVKQPRLRCVRNINGEIRGKWRTDSFVRVLYDCRLGVSFENVN